MSITSKWYVKDGVLNVEATSTWNGNPFGFCAEIKETDDPLAMCFALREVMKQASEMYEQDADWQKKLWSEHVSP